MSWRSVGKIQRKRIIICSKNNSEKKKDTSRKTGHEKRGDFLEDSILLMSSWELGVKFCSTFEVFSFNLLIQ